MKAFLETERLILRQFTEDDADDLFALDSDPEVVRFAGPHQMADPEAYRRHIRTKLLGYSAPALVFCDDRAPLGRVLGRDEALHENFIDK
jgi:RimJ/RimL family protein N-acetyltransferase